MSHIILDASAILALLKSERGASKVAGVIADASVCAINQAEGISHFVHLGAPLDDVRAMLGALPYIIAPVDDALAWEAGGLRSVTAPPSCLWATGAALRWQNGLAWPPILPTRRGGILLAMSAPRS